jgi:predicted nucleic acid-binding protein
MGALDLSGLPENALLLIDSAPIIYVLEDREFATRFQPLLDLQAAGAIRLAITTVAMIEVLTGPFATGDEGLARRYRAMFDSWRVVGLDAAIAESAARLRAQFRLKLADAVQLASALAINADALVTHDRDFSRVKGLRIIC